MTRRTLRKHFNHVIQNSCAKQLESLKHGGRRILQTHVYCSLVVLVIKGNHLYPSTFVGVMTKGRKIYYVCILVTLGIEYKRFVFMNTVMLI